MKLGTLLLGGVALGGLIGAGVYTWHPAATPGYEETTTLARARQAVVAAPDDIEGWLRFGDEARHVGDDDTAHVAYQRVRRLAPDDPRGHSRLGIMLVANGEDAAARPYLERAAALGCADAHFVLQGIEAPRPDGSVPVDDVR